MSTATVPAGTEALHGTAEPTYPKDTYLNDGKTVMSWLGTLDHKRIAILYLISVLFFFAVGGFFAMLVRLELLTPGPTVIDALAYNRAFTMHGIVMIFLFMIPAIPGV